MEAWEQLRVGELVHDGARSRVYRAVRDSDDLHVVVKVLKPAFDDAAHRARLLRELALASRVDARAAVKPLGTMYHGGRLALVLEDFGGKALNCALSGTPPLSTALPIAVTIARALGMVHRSGVVHRDVKPSNVIHRADTGETKLTDFGVAVLRGEAGGHRSELEGTFAYMAPEQSGQMAGVIDHRADLYAYGVLLYELFTGQRPFHATDALQWIHCHAAQAPLPLSQVAPALPDVLSRIVLKLLAKSPDERYQRAEGVEADLARCLDLLQRGDSLASFELALHGASDQLKLPERVYGRDREITVLDETFARTANERRRELLLISGYSGIGKTSLVRELRGPVGREGGYVMLGKFDQFRRHVPYSAFAQAGNGLIQQLLMAKREHLAAWKVRALKAMHGNAAVLVDIFPEIERVLGGLPNAPDLPATGRQNRLQKAAHGFFHAFDAPLALFLDDLQWADEASLELLESLLSQGTELPLLTVLAFRENEVRAEHPLRAALERARKAGTPVTELVLGPLPASAVSAMVGDTLQRRDASTEALATLVAAKTSGNPFFVREFLRTLHLDGLLYFDASTAAWCYDLAKVEASAITDNVVDLILGRLHQLTPSTRTVLRVAAFLGSDVDVDELAVLVGSEPSELTGDLRPAAAQGLITVSTGADGSARARFGHDRIQQAALCLTPEADRAAEHLRVARLLWSRVEGDGGGPRLFDVANHLDAAFALVVDSEERERLVRLFLLAAGKSKAATAYAQARTYLSRVAEIIGEEGWARRFETAFDVHVELAECDYLAGRLESAHALFAELSRRARSDLERARVFYLQIRLLQVSGDLAAAAELSLRSFALFGLKPPHSDEDAARDVEEQHRTALDLLGDRPVADRVDDPPMTDPNVRMLVDLLEASGPPIYMVKPALFPWVALQLVNHSLRYGNAEASCYGYGIYALLRAAVRGDVEGGYEFSQLAIRLNEKLGALKLHGCMLHLLGDHVNFWKNPIASDLPILERGFASCVRAGDHIYSNYIGFQAPWHLYESGAPLSEVMALTEKYASFALETKYAPVHSTIRAEQQLIHALMGRTSARGELGSEDFDEREALTELTKAGFGCGVVYLHIIKLVLAYNFGDFGKALEAAEAARPELGSAFSMPIYTTYCFYHALTLAALHDSGDAMPGGSRIQESAAEPERSHQLDAIRAYHGNLVTWAASCPANFADKAALVGAELARLSGDVAGALRLYEQARLAARSQGFVHYEALSCELAAKFYRSMGVDSAGRALMDDAAVLYKSWGATGKAAEISEEGSRPVGARDAGSSRTLDPEVTTQTTTSRELDMTSVLKAVQSLSAEIVLSRLLPRLMSIVVEYAGAQRGALVLIDGDAMTVAAEAAIGERKEITAIEVPRALSALPMTMLRYAQRTGEHVVIHDASASNDFSGDDYFANKRHRSVLCKPIERQGRLIGLFYLENDLVAGAFGRQRLATLTLLASQTAISIENSRLYDASQAAVLARDEFLAIASHELKTPLTPLAMQVYRLTKAIRSGSLRGMPDDALMKMAATCDAQVARMKRLVGALLDVSRIESGNVALHRERVDLAAVVGEVAERHGAECSAAGCAVTLRLQEGVTGEWDRMKLEQVASNLLSNAIKFGRGKPISLALERRGDQAVLTIVDHGLGIPDDDFDRIFQRFERARAQNNVEGLGLGLFIVRALVEAHEGQVRVGHTTGGGATFVVQLPLLTHTLA